MGLSTAGARRGRPIATLPCSQRNVRYLASIEFRDCVACGGEVRLFSAAEWTDFTEALEARNPKGGRPRTKFGKAAA